MAQQPPKNTGKPKLPGPRGRKLRSDGTPHASTTGGRTSPNEVDMTNWRTPFRRPGRIKFTDDAKRIFLEHFSAHGRVTHAAAAADITPSTVDYHLDNDPEFHQAFKVAQRRYRDRVHEVAEQLAFDGVVEPILGGRFKDTVVGEKRVYATNILLAEMRRTDPGHRDRAELDVNVKGGVLVAPAGMDPSDWAKKYAKADTGPSVE